MRRLATKLSLCIPLLVPSVPLLAQSVPLPDGDVLQLYDVHDLVRQSHSNPPDGGTEDHAAMRHQLEGLAAFARTFVQPPLADEQDIAALGHSALVVRAHASQHAWIAHVLATRRRSPDSLIDLELRVLTVPRDRFLEHFAPLLDGPPFHEASAVRDAGEDTQAWLARALSDENIQALTAPRVLLRPLQHAEVRTGVDLSYVKDYEVEQLAGRAIANPIVASLFDGVVIEATAGPVGGGAIGVSLHFEQQTVTQPIPKFTTSLAGWDEKITIDLPAWRRTELRQEIVVADGGLALAAANDGEDFAVVLVRAVMTR